MRPLDTSVGGVPSVLVPREKSTDVGHARYARRSLHPPHSSLTLQPNRRRVLHTLPNSDLFLSSNDEDRNPVADEGGRREDAAPQRPPAYAHADESRLPHVLLVLLQAAPPLLQSLLFVRVHFLPDALAGEEPLEDPEHASHEHSEDEADGPRLCARAK